MMEIKINDDYSIEHKNGYWIYHEFKVSEKGKVYKSNTQTYAKMLDMHHNLKLLGVCGDLIMKHVCTLLSEAQKEAGRYIIAQRKIKEKANA